jgi:hypothetical protein
VLFHEPAPHVVRQFPIVVDHEDTHAFPR